MDWFDEIFKKVPDAYISCMKPSIGSFRTLKFIIHCIFRGVGGPLCSLPLAGRRIYCSPDVVLTEAAASRLQINTRTHTQTWVTLGRANFDKMD